jgi:hypothetical protein
MALTNQKVKEAIEKVRKEYGDNIFKDTAWHEINYTLDGLLKELGLGD